MRYRLEREAQVTRDLERIYDFLFESYLGFGHAADSADAEAADRVVAIEKTGWKGSSKSRTKVRSIHN